MKRLIYSAMLTLVLTAFQPAIRTGGETPAQNQSGQLAWLEKWFSAWELISRRVLALPDEAPPEMLFFDDKYIYTTSAVSAPNGTLVHGPKFLGRQLPWRRVPHQGKIKLPDGQEVPVGLMTFAGPTGNGKVFFVMAAPAYWKQAGIESPELNLEKMLTGVFLHEFAHTRQFKGIGAQVDSIEKKHAFKEINLSDDIVQDYFAADSAYVKEFRREVDKFYQAAFARQEEEAKQLTREALSLLKTRQAWYFQREKTVLRQLDPIFLSMEGLGQFAAVAWLVHSEGGRVPFAAAVEGFRRNRKWWSQEEGLAMFLVLDRLTDPNWAVDVFGEKPKYITDLLEQAAGEAVKK